jgi:hypothetical protein
MRKNINIILGMLLCSYFTTAHAQILGVKKITQEQTEWCWAATSACILDYYNKPVEQCKIAEFARKNSEKINFGTSDCCIKPFDSCNQSNYNWGDPGSIEAILDNFGGIKSIGQGSLDRANIAFELTNNRPFIMRWQWPGPEQLGHFLVGHGFRGDTVFYMDPALNQGFKFGLYNWVSNSSDHVWNGTNKLLGTTGLPDHNTTTRQFVYPNPTTGKIAFKALPASPGTMIGISDISGVCHFSGPVPISGEIDLSALPKGLYILRIISDDQSTATKVVLQ